MTFTRTSTDNLVYGTLGFLGLIGFIGFWGDRYLGISRMSEFGGNAMMKRIGENRKFSTGVYLGIAVGLVGNLLTASYFKIMEKETITTYYVLFTISFVLLLIIFFLLWRIDKGEGKWD